MTFGKAVAVVMASGKPARVYREAWPEYEGFDDDEDYGLYVYADGSISVGGEVRDLCTEELRELACTDGVDALLENLLGPTDFAAGDWEVQS